MESPVEFTDYIQPICLPSNSQNIFNVRGAVSAYGQSGPLDLKGTETPFKLTLTTTRDLIECYESGAFPARVLSRRSFCANTPKAVLCKGSENISSFFYLNNFELQQFDIFK
jgi:hypothetical protein